MNKQQKQFWLMKSEPDVYSFERLQKDGSTLWSGVRNYQARNFMMQQMELGDEVLFYHSSTEPPGITGLARVSKKAVPDPTQFDKKSEYYDAKATKEKPIWYCVEVQPVASLKNYVSLESLRQDSKLKELLVLKRGQRLSIQPVTEKDFQHIKKMGGI
jgi:predicted RNA-binding protein with PUA-like domain